jgi:hydroxymethylglutaryl-CoA synthase
LPGWIAAGIEEAAERALPIEGQEWLLVGYGSGDTSEVLPARVVPGWQRAAAKIGFSNALANGVDLSRENYEALHDGREPVGLRSPVARGFVIDRIGREDSAKFQDYGIEYYRYLG